MTRTHQHPGLLFKPTPCTEHGHTAAKGLMQIKTSVQSGTALVVADHNAQPALLRGNPSIDAQKTKSFCCKAAGIIDPLSRTEEALVPHERLRRAAPAETTLIASYRPHAQPAKGYKQPGDAHA